MTTFLIGCLIGSIVFLVTSAWLLKRKCAWIDMKRREIASYTEPHEPEKLNGEWIGPGARPDGKEAC